MKKYILNFLFIFFFEKIINFKGKIFQTKNPEPAPEPEPGANIFATPKQKKNELRNLYLNFMQILRKILYVMKQV